MRKRLLLLPLFALSLSLSIASFTPTYIPARGEETSQNIEEGKKESVLPEVDKQTVIWLIVIIALIGTTASGVLYIMKDKNMIN